MRKQNLLGHEFSAILPAAADLTSEAVWRLLWPLRPPKSPPQNGSKYYKQYTHGYVGNGVTDFKSEVRFDLQDCLEAVVALEAAKRAHTKQYAHDYVDISDH